MADGVNKVILIGNLGKDPEMRYTANGHATSSFTLAVSRSWKSDNGRREETEWFTVVTWERLAEVVAQSLEKGRRVYVEGRLKTRSWDGPDGQKRYRTEVVAETVLFLSAARGESEESYPSYPAGDLDPDELPFD